MIKDKTVKKKFKKDLKRGFAKVHKSRLDELEIPVEFIPIGQQSKPRKCRKLNSESDSVLSQSTDTGFEDLLQNSQEKRELVADVK